MRDGKLKYQHFLLNWYQSNDGNNIAYTYR